MTVFSSARSTSSTVISAVVRVRTSPVDEVAIPSAVALMTAEEVDRALEKTVNYRAPGR